MLSVYRCKFKHVIDKCKNCHFVAMITSKIAAYHAKGNWCNGEQIKMMKKKQPQSNRYSFWRTKEEKRNGALWNVLLLHPNTKNQVDLNFLLKASAIIVQICAVWICHINSHAHHVTHSGRCFIYKCLVFLSSQHHKSL